jgi:hypothetical protein
MRPRALAALLAVGLSACGGARRTPASRSPVPAPAVAVPAATPPAIVAPVATPPSAADEARRAEREGRPADALAVFERLSTTPDARLRLEAQLGAARLRLSAEPATHDLRKAQLLLEGVEQSSPTADLQLRVSDVLQVLRESADLRAQLRSSRAEVKALEAEIAKKDEALRRVTSAVVGGRTP